MKKVTVLWLLTISASLSLPSCEKEDIKEDDIIVEKGNFSDVRDGQTYNWVKIDRQVWMAENLKFLPSVVGSSTYLFSVPLYYVHSYEGSDVEEAKVTDNYQIFGVLYNWPAALTACPTGWHLPSYEEWNVLLERIGKNAGTKLKAKNGWLDDGNGLDSYGFSALPGGALIRGGYPQAYFTDIGYWGNWWLLDESEAPNAAWYVSMGKYGGGVDFGFVGGWENGMSVRCLKD
jgi:uncharacterized protein (TIGR02145 family)